MANPTIEELQNSGDFELIAKLNHKEIKDFVINQLMDGGKLVRFFMIYQFLMVITGIFFLSRATVLLIRSNYEQFFFSILAIIFSFSFLIIIHELVHGIALIFTGAKKISYGGYLRKFIFYAEADQHVLNKKQFALVALAPLVSVKLITAIAILLTLYHPSAYMFIIIMSAHSLFCAGDIGLLSIFFKNPETEIFTYDVREEKTSYYYQKIRRDD